MCLCDERGEGALWGLFYHGTNLICEGSILTTSSPSKDPHLINHDIGGGTTAYELREEGTGIKSTTNYKTWVMTRWQRLQGGQPRLVSHRRYSSKKHTVPAGHQLQKLAQHGSRTQWQLSGWSQFRGQEVLYIKGQHNWSSPSPKEQTDLMPIGHLEEEKVEQDNLEN